MNNVGAAEDNFLKAITIFSAHFPRDQAYALCLEGYGDLLRSNGRKAEARANIEAAFQLYIHNSDQEGATDCQSILQLLLQ